MPTAYCLNQLKRIRIAPDRHLFPVSVQCFTRENGRDNTLVTERAIAAAVPEEFVTALVSKTLGELPIL